MTPRPVRSSRQRSRGAWTGTSFIATALACFCLLHGPLAHGQLTHGQLAHGRLTLPAPLQSEGFEARLVGGGLLTWFGFDIYDASLWTPDGRFHGFAGQPIAFSLWYRRGFSRERLIDITQNGWTKFRLATPQQQAAWSAQLRRIWLDTHAGANMTTLVLPAGETRFYNAERYLGSIHDAAFGPAFLSIWLDPQTRGTRLEKLRTALLGLGKPAPPARP